MLTLSHIFSGLISPTFVPDLYGLIRRILCLTCIGPYCNVAVTLVQHGFIANGPLYPITLSVFDIKRFYHDYKVGDKVMINNHAAYKYETPYKGHFFIKKCCTNGTVALQYGVIKIRCNMFFIKPYKSYTNIEDINPEKYV